MVGWVSTHPVDDHPFEKRRNETSRSHQFLPFTAVLGVQLPQGLENHRMFSWAKWWGLTLLYKPWNKAHEYHGIIWLSSTIKWEFINHQPYINYMFVLSTIFTLVFFSHWNKATERYLGGPILHVYAVFVGVLICSWLVTKKTFESTKARFIVYWCLPSGELT